MFMCSTLNAYSALAINDKEIKPKLYKKSLLRAGIFYIRKSEKLKP